ncbi:MAG: pantoate--beta-alanine ligase [Clostridia bacterium]|nr:pantoate--beta-alanine ligase [Clostridia bacterium]
MKILEAIGDIREEIKEARRNNKSVGFVPTMGYLHGGHLSLIKKAKEENDLVIVSIFVNPTQFGPGEDFESYPRDLKKDSSLAQSMGADIVFSPSIEEMYPLGCSTYVEIEGDITKKLCGASRSGHFKGVATVVTKLFNIVMPNRAYFGQKDAQQVAVIKRMVKDLHLDVEIVPCPIVREGDGLAMSSRNTYLNEEERRAGTILSKALFEAKERIEEGEINPLKISYFIIETIESEPLCEIDYVEVVHGETLESIERVKGDVLIALAVKIGKTRLIDNLRLEV